ncbi:hypothetical protein GCM10008965_23730 [Methylorubrum aminovorans]|nr:hypothetical protein GCM10025880_28010 [Methylorubrum aminovorans]
MAIIGATMMNTVMPMMKAGNHSGIGRDEGGSGRIGGMGARKARSGSRSRALMVRGLSR